MIKQIVLCNFFVTAQVAIRSAAAEFGIAAIAYDPELVHIAAHVQDVTEGNIRLYFEHAPNSGKRSCWCNEYSDYSNEVWAYPIG